MQWPAVYILALLLVLAGPLPVAAQDQPPAARPDTLEAADTTGVEQADPAAGGRTATRRDAPPADAVQFSARDSLVIDLEGEDGDTATLFGEAETRFQDASLQAYRIVMLMEQEELRAEGLPSDTGMIGRPYFERGEREGFSGQALAYNMRTERGRVVQARTTMDEGFIEGGVVKTHGDSLAYIQAGQYTTCDCPPGETPSYSLRASRMKVTDDQWVYTGPIQLYIFNIPTPLILPFGFLPQTEGRRSGPLAPSYGEDQRGFFLRDWGYYWAINEYMDFQTQFGIWSQGSWQVRPRFRYAQRYAYQGNLQLDYIREKRGDIVDPDFSRRTSSSLRWRHNQTLNPTTNFSANVDLSNQSYLRTNTDNYDDQVRQEISSSISYSKRWPNAGRSLNMNLTHRQTLTTGATNVTLPSLTFTQSNIQPFERDQLPPGEEASWYERITTSYRGTLRNQFQFNPLSEEQLRARGDSAAIGISWYDALFSPSDYRRATGQQGTPFNVGVEHRIPVSASFSLNRLPLTGQQMQLNLSPRLNYQENWYLETTRREVVDSTVVEEPEPGFFALRQFDLGLSANTTFYGTFPVSLGPFDGLRHTVNPSLSFSYRPDFERDLWGYTRTYTDVDGQEVRYPIVRDVPTSGEQRTLSLSVRNDFQTRRVSVDTTGEQSSRTVNLLNLNVSTGYNFAADSLALSDLRVTGRTNILDRLSLNLNSTLSPYAEIDGRRVDRLLLTEPGWRFLRLESFRLSLSTSFQSDDSPGAVAPGGGPGGAGGPGGPQQPGRSGFPGPQQPDADLGISDAEFRDQQLTDFSIPWSVNLDFTFSHRSGSGSASSNTRATLNTRFDLNITPKWRVGGATGFDFVQREIVRTNIDVTRDLDCWQMNFSWNPFGRLQSYRFSIFVKSGKLRDLLRLDVPSSDVRDRFGQAIR